MPKEQKVHLGIWAARRKNYLMQYKKVMYYNLLTSCELNSHLAEIEESAQQMMEAMIEQMMEREGLTENLKETEPMKWTALMNNIRQAAREAVLNDLIYS
nr:MULTISPECIES: TnpV protein [Anaerotruncus]